ncbi:MAG: type IV pilus twitching motility protein PilT [Thermodesulfovibrionales bacterium]
MKDINELLRIAAEQGASDLHVKVGSPPVMRVNGELVPLSTEERVNHEDAMKVASAVMSAGRHDVFKKRNDMDFAYSVSGLGRFRCNAFYQRGVVGLVFRLIPTRIPSVDELNLPEILKKVALEERGLILVTGTTGSGKTTTLASMIDMINSSRTVNIVTIEDPIEYLHRDKKGLVNQREIGVDTRSFAGALRAALRQDPDVILVGEMRDLETIETAMTAAETGHLVMSTLHTTDASETVNRIISVFPPHQHQQIRLQLSSIIKGIISLRLIPRADGLGRVPAVEVLLATGLIKDCILDPEKTKFIPDAIAQGKMLYGMQTFDQSVFDLYSAGLISYEEGLRWSTKPEDFKLKVKGVHSTSDMAKDGPGKDKKDKSGPGGPDIQRFAK